MESQRERICGACFVILVVVGVGFVFIGLLVAPMLPYFQLDAVLTPTELANDQKREATLALLKKAAGNTWFFWSVGGLIVAAVSAFGLWVTRATRSRSPG